ncbi:MAG TPA: hypothetical protein VM425_09530 [Myxococcota bacterium]|nr:hypothetical protein [Myxococcota bacterium]
MNGHLNSELYERLLTGRLSVAEERRLFTHLGQDCEECENFMAELDAEQLGMLMEILERTSDPEDLSPAAREQVLAGRPERFFGMSLRLLPAAGIAMLAVIGIGLALVHFAASDEGETTRIKGADTLAGAPAIGLTVGRLRADVKNAAGIERIASGGKVVSSERLVFRIDTTGPCYLYLACQTESSLEMLSPASGRAPIHHPGGAYSPETAGHPAAFSLKDHAGKLRFVALCAIKPLEIPQDVLRISAGSPGPAGVVSFDVVTVTVSKEVELP